MQAPGLEAYARRDPKRTGIYAFENAQKELPAEYDKALRNNKTAWKYFEQQPAYYKKRMVHWVTSAKKEETRLRRLQQLVDGCEQGVRVGELNPKTKNNA